MRSRLFLRACLAPMFLAPVLSPLTACAETSPPVTKAGIRGLAVTVQPRSAPFVPTPPATSRAPAPIAIAKAPSRSTARFARTTPKQRVKKVHTAKGETSGAGSLHAIRDANAGALAAPASSAFVNAALYYDYELGRLYRIDASPRFLTTITLRPGEKLVSKAAGDTVRWVLGETVQGTGDTAQVLVFVKPVRGGQRTNIVLTTDQRTYHLEAVSHEQPLYTSVISWNYPLEQAREAQAAAARLAERQAAIVNPAVPVDNLNFAYKVEHPHQRRGPKWEPARVFDDGAKTYIQFPADLGSAEAPPLFLIGPRNEAELVNYRVKGAYYVVDRIIDVAELRLGEKPQTVVRITRKSGRG